MKVSNRNTTKNVVKFPTESVNSAHRQNSKSLKRANKLLKLGIAIGVLATITLAIGFEVAVIVGLGMIIGSKILPDFIKPNA